MNILFTNDDDNKKNLYELGFKMNFEDAKCVNLSEAGIKNKVKFEVSNLDEKERAVEYSKLCDYLTVSVKESLYIDGLPEAKQPGTSFKMIAIDNEDSIKSNLTNIDIASHYAEIVKQLGGSANAKWVDDVTIAYKGKVVKSFKVENNAVLTSKISKNIDKSNPINSITLIPEFGDIHYSDCNLEEIKFLNEIKNKKVINYISNAVKEIRGE